MITRKIHPPKGSFFLFGPRGTGKSTWIRAVYPKAYFLDLLDPGLFRSFTARPERLREAVEAHPVSIPIVIDEVQKIPELLSVVHSLLEEKTKRQFILTGSSSRKLKRTGIDLLAGRALKLEMHPFLANELAREFNLEKALQNGMIPLVWDSPDARQTLSSYVELYIREEVKAEGLVRNLGSFNRFLEAVSWSHASVLNLSAVSRECETGRKTVEGYLSVLEDILLSFRIPVFSRKAKRALLVHEKFYLFDTGVFRTIRPSGPLDRPEEIEGAALEGLVCQHLKAWCARGQNRCLSFWKTKQGQEVDFVLYGPHLFIAIEVKNSGKIRPEDLRSLKSFLSDYPSAKPLLLYRGKERLKTGGILCLPCSEFLRALDPNRLPETG